MLEIRKKNEKLSRANEFCVIELFHSKKINEKKTKKEVDAKLFSTGTLTHNFAFKPVYNQGSPVINEGTTFQEAWVTVDYIFYR